MNYHSRRSFAAVVLASAALPSAHGQSVDTWAPIRRLLGKWNGQSSGRPGDGTVVRTYAFVMNERFVQEINVSTYPPQERSPKGERHEHWGYFSYDMARKLLVLRQFHVEGFVNTYRQAPATPDPSALVFDSEAFENLPASWRARESYTYDGDDRFNETFELAAPGKDFEVYSRAQFKRVKE